MTSQINDKSDKDADHRTKRLPPARKRSRGLLSKVEKRDRPPPRGNSSGLRGSVPRRTRNDQPRGARSRKEAAWATPFPSLFFPGARASAGERKDSPQPNNQRKPIKSMNKKKIALITGANKGIGLETARQLGKQDITVLLGARDSQKGKAATEGLRKDGIDAHSIVIDVSNPESIRKAAESGRARLRPARYSDQQRGRDDRRTDKESERTIARHVARDF